MRIGLANELSELINEYGPRIYDDFNEVSIANICHMSLSQIAV